MAAKNGAIKTTLYLIIFVLVMCAVLFYVGFFVGGSMSRVLVEPNNGWSEYRPGFHDHRL